MGISQADLRALTKRMPNDTSRPFVNDIQGWMSDAELGRLYLLASKMKTVVEIGSWRGRSTFALCKGCKNGKVYAVDHFLGSSEHQDFIKRENLDVYSLFMENMKGFTNLEVFRMSSEEAAKSDRIPTNIDMVFIDGAHEEEHFYRDLELWYGRTGIVLCGHDWQYASIRKAMSRYVGEHIRDVKNVVDTLWELNFNGEELV